MAPALLRLQTLVDSAGRAAASVVDAATAAVRGPAVPGLRAGGAGSSGGAGGGGGGGARLSGAVGAGRVGTFHHGVLQSKHIQVMTAE
jgi:hypothetical protein